jgi:hypothetical protein
MGRPKNSTGARNDQLWGGRASIPESGSADFFVLEGELRCRHVNLLTGDPMAM